MIRLSLSTLVEELLTFNYSTEIDEAVIRGTLLPLIEDVVNVTNVHEEDQIYDVIHRYEYLLKGNSAVEASIQKLFNDIMGYRRLHRYDTRLRMRLYVPNQKILLFVYVVMDLDATLKYENDKNPLDEPTDVDELVCENPTPAQLSALEKAAHH